MNKINLLNFDLDGLEELVLSLGEKSFRANQIFKWIHEVGCRDFDSMTNLSVSFRSDLKNKFSIDLPSVSSEKIASDGTIRWVMKLACNNSIETVYIPEKSRGTLCVSSQAGCAANCQFCSTAVGSFNKNLSVAEIIGQLRFANNRLREIYNDSTKVTNVVMMGMGEPLLNFDSVVKAMSIMLDDNAYGLSKYKVTLSTVGIVPKLIELSKISPVAVTVSLHAANDKLRSEIIPVNKKYPLADLMKVCRDYFPKESKRKITFAYLMLDGINDSDKDAKELVRLISNIPSKVNLIPFNTYPGAIYSGSSMECMHRFKDILQAKGVQTTIRKTRGDDVQAACGQLVGDILKRQRRSVESSVRI